MKELSSYELQHLKSLAHDLEAIVRIGKNGVTRGVVTAVDNALNDHNLIKVKFLDYKRIKKELSLELADKTNSHLIDIIGNIAVFYRPDV